MKNYLIKYCTKGTLDASITFLDKRICLSAVNKTDAILDLVALEGQPIIYDIIES